MRLPLYLSVAILLVCGGLGWREQAAISAMAADNERLVAQAHELGLGTGDLSGRQPLPRSLRRMRGSGNGGQEDARAFCGRMIDYMLRQQKELETAISDPPQPGKEASAVIGELLQLDPAQLRIALEEIRTTPRLTDEMRSGVIGIILMALADSDPSGALALLSASPGLIGDEAADSSLISPALEKVAQKSPQEAMAWLWANAQEHPAWNSERARLAILEGTARDDPRLAFSLIGELGNPDGAELRIAWSAKTPAAQAALVTALRDHLETLSDDEEKSAARGSVLPQLGRTAVDGSYDKAALWLENANLSREEAKEFASGIQADETGGDSGKWIAWLGEKLPPEDYRERADEIMDYWTGSDYRAAESWLKEQPDGPVRDIAVKAYVRTIAEYLPEMAEQWAMTLPEGDERNGLLDKIRVGLQGGNGEAAEAFSRRHGLQK